MTERRSLPSVDQLLRASSAVNWTAEYGRPLVVQAIRQALEEARRLYQQKHVIPGEQELLDIVDRLLHTWIRPSLQPVINATGVILHTNLGRAPLSQASIQAIQEVALGYSNLEYNLQTGKRGSRLVHTEQLLKQITGAEAALVVNNNASAILLVLTAMARRRRVVIARSQLIEIGGGFRLPDVMVQSGSHLVEVGTTNRVHLSDFETVLTNQPVALVLRAHHSNFKIIGFTSEPGLSELVTLAHQVGVPLVDDLGSGALLDTTRFGLSHEPMVQESLAAGADLVCFSGDKLLGGPQAGIIIGHADPISKLKKHPLARAVRADKLCLAGLSATLLHYLKGEVESEIPVWRMIACSLEELQARAQGWITHLGAGQAIPGESTIGGGSLPEETLPTCLLSLKLPSPNRAMTHLRQAPIPIIARLQDNLLVLDPRTVLPEQDDVLLEGLTTILKDGE
jgi:L-seryl-tRNA(Ser) seleniumtransferase